MSHHTPAASSKFTKTRNSLWVLLIALGAPLWAPQEAGAQRLYDGPALSFSNLELGYERRFFDADRIDDANGFHAGISFAPIPGLYFTGDFHYANAEEFLTSEEDIDFIDASAGIGLRATLAGALAVYVEGGVAYGKFDRPESSDISYDGVGFYVEPGLKIGLFGRVEGSVAAELTVLEDEEWVGAKAGLMIGITDNFGLTVDAGVSEHTDYVGVGMRISW